MRSHFLFVVLLSGMSLVHLGCSDSRPGTLTIAAAANVQFAMDSLVQVFGHESGVECEVVVSSSGKLTAQISKGAPYDIFLSADMKYPKALFEEGHLAALPTVYAQGSLVLWQIGDSALMPELKDLTSENIESIAIANPSTAPYGVAALQLFDSLGLFDQLESKLIYGESIAQTNHFISSGAADLGFTSKSVVLSPQMNNISVLLSCGRKRRI